MQIPKINVPTVAIRGTSERFPVRRIYCVGLNYADHAREMGKDPDRHPPFFFGKPSDAVVASGARLPYPAKTQDFHHEVEMVVALGAGGAEVKPEAAIDLVYGYAVGIDLTRRDLQAEAKKLGRPWDLGKGFDHSAPVGSITRGKPPSDGAIGLYVNGHIKQSGDLTQMIWGVAEIIAILSGFISLGAGDLIFTGTPSGVGPIARGDKLRGELAGADPLEVSFT
ncbi:MAG TPA: fumarylacetoacetate hydrolase family protein [Steroidobacteraceae bacterium]|jgi:fumarylpyruvate hydrolase